MPDAPDLETLTHRLILPRDANHHGTLYAGSMLSLVLEAGYATAYRAVGPSANLVLKRVLDLRCFEPVSIGRVVEIRGREVHRARAQVVVGLSGTPLPRPVEALDGRPDAVRPGRTSRAGPSRSSVEPDDAGLAELPAPWAVAPRPGPAAPGDPRLTGDPGRISRKSVSGAPPRGSMGRPIASRGGSRSWRAGNGRSCSGTSSGSSRAGACRACPRGSSSTDSSTSRDEVAFGAIVARHGPMVLGVCRGVLDDPHDVEDAFQATFLVLVRKAGGLRDRDLLGQWLYGVARKVALRARADAARRKARERAGTRRPSRPVEPSDAELRELQAIVREEVDRLPANDRMAVVLCYLEGLTHEEAAEPARLAGRHGQGAARPGPGPAPGPAGPPGGRPARPGSSPGPGRGGPRRPSRAH